MGADEAAASGGALTVGLVPGAAVAAGLGTAVEFVAAGSAVVHLAKALTVATPKPALPASHSN